MESEKTKKCYTCGAIKAASMFSRCTSKKDGLASSCRECRRIKRKIRYQDPASYHQNLKKRRIRDKIYRQNNPEKMKNYDLIHNFGITLKDYDHMYKIQDGKCLICGTDKPSRTHKYFTVDHCHKTGKIRGLLCSDCNKALGIFKENPKLLRSAAEYLEKQEAICQSNAQDAISHSL